MAYQTTNEWMNFNFQNSQIVAIRKEGTKMCFELGFVTILGNNSCNRDIREMGTNALVFLLEGVSEVKLVLEGYQLFDADGNLQEKVEDELIGDENSLQKFDMLNDSTIYELKKEGDEYQFYIDTEERTYTLFVKAAKDIQQWERFMNKTPSY